MTDNTKHEIAVDVLIFNGEVHRYENAEGVPLSAIYQNGVEMYTCERKKELHMIEVWNENKTKEFSERLAAKLENLTMSEIQELLRVTKV